jgi:hypothetical protein
VVTETLQGDPRIIAVGERSDPIGMVRLEDMPSRPNVSRDLVVGPMEESLDVTIAGKPVGRNLGVGFSVPRSHLAFRPPSLRLLRILWAVVASKALQSGLSIRGVVDVETDRDEGTNLPVLRVYLDTTAAPALAFWDGLEPDLDRWMSREDEGTREQILNDIGLRIHWRR